MSLSERLKKMEAFRQVHGNRCFKKGDFVSALKWYEKSLLYYEYCLPTKKQEREAADKERELSLTNSAACHLGLKNYRQCVDCCTEALEVANGESIKALYRRAKAYRFMCDFGRAMSDLEKAKIITGGDNKAANVLQNILHDEHCTLQAAILSYREDSKIAAKKMMQSTD
jgi:tetratricopeptide (TPR) repeat protein